MEIKNGQRVFVVESYGWNTHRYTPGTVIGVTPSGLFDVSTDVQSDRLSITIRFNKDLRERGRSYPGQWVDKEMSFEDREKYVVRENALNKARTKLCAVFDEHADIRSSNKEGLEEMMRKAEVGFAQARSFLEKA